MKAEKYTFSENATQRTYSYNSGTNRQDLGYEYDLNGNILKKKNRTPDSGISGTTLGVDGLDNQYTYDAISRLLTATGRESDANNESHRWADAPVAGSPNANNTQTYTRNYIYDKVGNIQSLQQTGSNAFTRSFNYTDNTLDDITVSETPTVFTYDTNGNLTQSGESRYYEWNEKDQLVFFKIQAGEEPSVYAHYLYDASGNRTKKIVWDQQGNKEVTVYIDGIFEYRLKQEDSTDKEQNIIHIMDDSTRIAQLRIGTEFNADISETIHYILDDHLGSSNARLDNSGSIIDRQEFYPFGDTSLRTYSFKRYQYVGKEKDAESGLIYYGARYYAAWACRFISVDPLASKYQFYSPYIYAGNKPINKVDIDGLQEEGNGGGEQNSGGSTSPRKELVGPVSSATIMEEKVHRVQSNFPNSKLPVTETKMDNMTAVDDSKLVELPKDNIKANKLGSEGWEIPMPYEAPTPDVTYDTFKSLWQKNNLPFSVENESSLFITKGREFGGKHKGIDIIGKDPSSIDGKNIISNVSGTITRIVNENTGLDSDNGGYRLRIKLEDGSEIAFNHLQEGSNNHLSFGSEIKAGDVIGKVGSTGGSSGPHLHFEVWEKPGVFKSKIDPAIQYPAFKSLKTR